MPLKGIECRNLRCEQRAVYEVAESRMTRRGYAKDREGWSGQFCADHLQAALEIKLRSLDRANYLKIRRL